MALAAEQATAIVEQLYSAVLGRLPDSFGYSVLVPLVQSGYDPGLLRSALAFASPEAANLVSGIYQAELGRAPDAPGLNQYLGALAGGLSLDDVRASIGGSAEAMDAAAAVYTQTLGRTADASGLALYRAAVSKGVSLGDMRAQLAASPEAGVRLTYSYQESFGIAPSAATLSTLRGELSRGKSLGDTTQVDDRQSRTSGFFFNNDGYTVQSQYSATGIAQFLSIYDDSFRFYQGPRTTIPVASAGPSALAPGPDSIVLDLSSIGAVPVTFVATLDGQPLGGAVVSTTPANQPFSPFTVDQVTFTGDFGAVFHDLHVSVLGDPALNGVGVSAAKFDGNAFLLGGANTGSVGSFSIYPHPGPQPHVNAFLYFP